MAKRSRSILKRQRQEEKKRLRNKSVKTRLRTLVKKTKSLALEQKTADVSAALKQAVREIDKAVSKGVIHKRNAARKKSRLQKFTRKFGEAPKVQDKDGNQ